MQLLTQQGRQATPTTRELLEGSMGCRGDLGVGVMGQGYQHLQQTRDTHLQGPVGVWLWVWHWRRGRDNLRRAVVQKGMGPAH